jgi:Ca2+-transporting ATPase
VLKELNSREDGLSAGEAAARLHEYGYNELKAAPKRGILSRFLSQFASFMILVLIAAAVIAALLGKWIDAGAISVILLLNAVLGTVQEYRAEKAIEALRRMAVPTARVLRSGKEDRVPAREIVPGDVIVIEAGDRIPADARLLEAAMLEINEASLTGESAPVTKEAEKAFPEDTVVFARLNMLFAGTTVTGGRGKAVVVATGMRSEFGKIASSVQEVTAEETPLQQELERFGRQLSLITVAGVIVLFLFGVLSGVPSVQMFLTSVSLAVAVIPEGLPAVMTIALALGVQRMSKRNAIVRRLLAVETLGSTNVILTDKTGTLTKNEMTARTIYASGEFYEVTGSGYENRGSFLKKGRKIAPLEHGGINAILHVSALCNNASIVYDGEKKTFSAIGDPTEAALLALAHKAALHRRELKKKMRFVGELPFDSARKRMTVVYSGAEGAGETLAFTKGALEYVLNRCAMVLVDGRERPITAGDKERILDAQRRMAGDALRVLAFAQRRIAGAKRALSVESVERGMTFLGLVGIIDAPRKEVPAAIGLCKRAGIDVVMITGDNEITARAVAREVGMLRAGDLVVTGQELSGMSEDELAAKIERIRVYARVAPEHKLRIVKAWKASGKVVAVTGDGVNDAPALKHADIGVAMGITGTDVAKEVSQMTLTDDNFASIVSAVEEGRGIYENIRKCIFFIFPANIAEVLVVFLSILLNFQLPLTAIQILWVNLVTETIPGFALAVDPVEKEVMLKPPRARRESLWKGGRAFLLDYSLILTVATLGLFALMLEGGDVVRAQTVVFTTIVVSGVFRAFNCRSLTSPWKSGMLKNKWLVFTGLLIFAMQFAVVSLPAFGPVFGVKPLNLLEWAAVVAVCVASFAYLETRKAFYSARAPKRG